MLFVVHFKNFFPNKWNQNNKLLRNNRCEINTGYIGLKTNYLNQLRYFIFQKKSLLFPAKPRCEVDGTNQVVTDFQLDLLQFFTLPNTKTNKLISRQKGTYTLNMVRIRPSVFKNLLSRYIIPIQLVCNFLCTCSKVLIDFIMHICSYMKTTELPTIFVNLLKLHVEHEY